MVAVTSVLAFTTAAQAQPQAWNIAFGGAGDSGPPATYAAAGQAGVWNTISGVENMSFDLVTTDGSASPVTLSQSPTMTDFSIADPSISGDDAKLLDNGLVTTGAETCVSFYGVTPGTYEVLVYAWTPDGPSVLSRTRQDEAVPETKDIGGAWPGHHEEGITYARYVVVVDAGGVLPTHSGLAPGQPSAALNGIQIRPLTAAEDAGPQSPDAGQGTPPDAFVPRGEDIDAGVRSPANGNGGGGCDAGGSGVGGGMMMLALALVIRRRR